MPTSHPPYPPQFRAEAVELVRTSNKSLPQFARDLGIPDQALHYWMKHSDIDAGHGRPGELTTEEREEPRWLRRENEVFRQERVILEKPQPSSRRRRREPLSVH